LLLFVLLAQSGTIGYLDELMGCYRLHETSWWQVRPHEERCLFMLGLYDIVQSLLSPENREKYTSALDQNYIDRACSCNPDAQPKWSCKVGLKCLRRIPYASNKKALVREGLRLAWPVGHRVAVRVLRAAKSFSAK